MIKVLSKAFFSILIFGCIYKLYDCYFNNLIYTISSYDGKKYKVRNHSNKEKAANVLAELRARLEKLNKYLQNKYYSDNKCVNLIKQRFKPSNISETPQHSRNTSYSVNKGEQLVFCIRPKNDDSLFHEVNLLMFVAIHELAHVGSKSIGHNNEFYENFVFLLNEATQIGVYEKIDFDKDNKDYCGMKITSSPI